ncbi:MAG: aromatic ring-hydroxylating dioxygenase subunit alpha [Chloroflexi bacterium]|nr:aromatic ring-hydroxylating dioxygenase subunit alpha [Chloroflexota bacterium]
MLSKEHNDLLTHTGPGTPGGDLMRRYWLPALLSEELPEPDCAPVRVKLLSEDLVAFRDSEGRVGILDEFCPHRRASLWLGRNEESGLRCVYHGWKFDVHGACLDQMNEPRDMQFTSKVRIAAYPTVEFGGIIWTYMGPAAKQPPLPKFEWTQAAETHRFVNKTWEECNWLQALEGGIDTSHAPILHRAMRTNPNQPGISVNSAFVRGKAPTLDVDVSDYGYMYAGIREVGDVETYVRMYHFVMPFTQIRPQQLGGRDRTEFHPIVAGHFWVPMDDHNCMVWNWRYSYGGEAINKDPDVEHQAGRAPSDQLPNFRKKQNRDNDWLIDRQAQKTDTFTVIAGINTQDHAVQESMGPIVDRSKEHLGPADKAIITTRQLLLKAIKTVQDGGDPPGLADSYYGLRAQERVFPRDADWRRAFGAAPASTQGELVGV